MKHAWRVIVPTLAGLVLGLALGVWAGPSTTVGITHLGLTAQAAEPTQSVSGKIATVAKDSFTLTVASLGQAPNAAKTMTFMIDPNTTIEGKLAVGANADVTFRQDKGRNVAVSVRVSP